MYIEENLFKPVVILTNFIMIGKPFRSNTNNSTMSKATGHSKQIII